MKELLRGRMIHDDKASPLGGSPLTDVTNVQLKPNGSVAWMHRTSPIDVPMNPSATSADYLPFYVVAKSDRNGPTVLDSGRDIRNGMLSLRGDILYWFKAGLGVEPEYVPNTVAGRAVVER